MLAGWTTFEARLATVFLLLLVFVGGMLPARGARAGQFQVARMSPPTVQVSAEGTELAPDLRHHAPPPAGDGPIVGSEGNLELGLLNQDRARAGLPPLAESASLGAVATVRARQLVADGMTHYRPGHSVLAAVELMQAAGVPYVWHGENIIWEGGIPRSQVPGFFNDWWMGSPHHRANILNPRYRSVGIGVAETGDRVYMVELFTDQVDGSRMPPTLALPRERGRDIS